MASSSGRTAELSHGAASGRTAELSHGAAELSHGAAELSHGALKIASELAMCEAGALLLAVTSTACTCTTLHRH